MTVPGLEWERMRCVSSEGGFFCSNHTFERVPGKRYSMNKTTLVWVMLVRVGCDMCSVQGHKCVQQCCNLHDFHVCMQFKTNCSWFQYFLNFLVINTQVTESNKQLFLMC